MEPESIGRAYALIGRIIVAWAHLDRIVIAETWQTKFPGGQWPDGAAAQFRNRLNDWMKQHGGPGSDNDKFAETIRAMIDQRDDLAHNVSQVEEDQYGKAVVFIHWFNRNWRSGFEKWKQYLHLPWRARPLPPLQDRSYWMSEAELEKLLAGIEAGTAEIKARSLAFRSSAP